MSIESIGECRAEGDFMVLGGNVLSAIPLVVDTVEKSRDRRCPNGGSETTVVMSTEGLRESSRSSTGTAKVVFACRCLEDLHKGAWGKGSAHGQGRVT